MCGAKDKTWRVPRLAASAALALLAVPKAYAVISDGSTNYSLGMDALAEMTTEVVVAMGYIVGLLYAIASLLAIYNAMVIYIKMQTGEGGFTKAVVMLVGAVLFLIGATIVLPAFFGYDAVSGW